MSRASFLPALSNRTKEIWIRQPTLRYISLAFVATFAFIACILILVMLVVSPYFFDIESRDAYGIADIHGDSMYPTIDDGGYAFIEYNTHPDFNVTYGDIVIYYNDDAGRYVAHRIVDIQEDKIITKGDNNDYYDTPIDTEDIQAKVIRVSYNYFDKWCYEAWINAFNWW